MNKLFKNFFILILLIVFITAFSSSYLSLSVGNLAYVLAIGIDSSNTDKYRVTFQFSTSTSISETGTSKKTPTISKSVEAGSLSSAINLMNSYMGKELNLSHCKIIVFSEEIAYKGLSDEIYTLINDTQVRPSANIIVSQCNAKYYIENTKPDLEKLISKYYEIFTNSSSYTGFMPRAKIGDFFNNLVCKGCMPYAITGNITSNQTENIGLAAFDGDKFVRKIKFY